jgi:excisionase family DNA binding protein
MLRRMAVEDWITQEEAAKKLHIALDTMRRYVREGRFARVKVGKRYLIPSKALEDFLLKGVEYGPRPVTKRKPPASKEPAIESPTGVTPPAAHKGREKSGS